METIKTLKDCAECLTLRICDAHITGGTWPHRKGINPCRLESTMKPIAQDETTGADWIRIFHDNEYERLTPGRGFKR